MHDYYTTVLFNKMKRLKVKGVDSLFHSYTRDKLGLIYISDTFIKFVNVLYSLSLRNYHDTVSFYRVSFSPYLILIHLIRESLGSFPEEL